MTWRAFPSTSRDDGRDAEIVRLKDEINRLVTQNKILEIRLKDTKTENETLKAITVNASVQSTAKELLEKNKTIQTLNRDLAILRQTLTKLRADYTRVSSRNDILQAQLTGNLPRQLAVDALNEVDDLPEYPVILAELFNIFKRLAATSLSKAMPFTDNFMTNGDVEQSFEGMVITALQVLDDDWRSNIMEDNLTVSATPRHVHNLIEIYKYNALTSFAQFLATILEVKQVAAKTHILKTQFSLNTEVLISSRIDFCNTFVFNKSFAEQNRLP